MEDNNPIENDEIDLREIFSSLWAFRVLIGFVTAAAVIVSMFYVFNTRSIYTARIVFELTVKDANNALSGANSTLAKLVGLSGIAGKELDTIFDRIRGRNFISEVSNRLNLKDDPYFIPKVKAARGIDLSFIKDLFRFNKTEIKSHQENITSSIVDVYLDNILVEYTESGSIKVEVSHFDPDRAALIANTIAQQLEIQLIQEKRDFDRIQLLYVSEVLANLTIELENTQQAALNFALANSLDSEEQLAIRSRLLFDLRENLRLNQKMQSAAEALLAVLGNSVSASDLEYQNIRRSHPIVDNPEFRRLLGTEGDPTTLVWPQKDDLASVVETLKSRVLLNEGQILELERDIERYAVSNKERLRLKREAEITEATHKILIEQVRSLSLLSGFQGEVIKIYESAVPPNKPSGPNKKLIVVIGGVLGLSFGMTISLIFATISARLYSRNALHHAVGASLNISVTGLNRSYKGDAKRIMQRLHQSEPQGNELFTLSLEHCSARKPLTLFLSSALKLSALPAALWLAVEQTKAGIESRVLVLDDSIDLQAQESEKRLDILQETTVKDVKILTPASGVSVKDIFLSDTHSKLLKQCREKNVILSVVVSKDYAAAVARAFNDIESCCILVSRVGISEKGVIQQIQQIKKIDANMEI